MPITRKFTNIPPLHSMSELLVALQLDGRLDDVELPDWAPGTSVAEVFDAVRLLGDGEWVGEAYPDYGTTEACDHWLSEFLQGKSVPLPDDPSSASEEEVSNLIDEYIANALTAKEATAFRKALKAVNFKSLAGETLVSISELTASAFVAGDVDFKKSKAKMPLLQPKMAVDPLLAAMAEFMASKCDGIFEQFREAGIPGDAARGKKRMKGIASAVKKAAARA